LLNKASKTILRNKDEIEKDKKSPVNDMKTPINPMAGYLGINEQIKDRIQPNVEPDKKTVN